MENKIKLKSIINKEYIDNLVMRPELNENIKKKMHVAFIRP